MFGQQCMTIKLEMNKVLFLHGMFAQNSSKPYFIESLGFNVYSPILNDWIFGKSVEIAQESFEQYKPNLIVGSSRGAAVAMNMDTGDIPLILLSPAWSVFGKQSKCKKNSVIIHSENDRLIPVKKSQELSKISECELIVVGEDHRLNCPAARFALAKVLARYRASSL